MRVFVMFCLFALPLCVLDGLRLVIVALPGLFSFFFVKFNIKLRSSCVISNRFVDTCNKL